MSAMLLLSGTAALIYEVVWMRMLTRAFGVTVHAVAALLAIYMAGLALGAAAASGRRAPASLRVYGWLEAAIGASALLATWLMPRLPLLIARLSPDAPLSAELRAALAIPIILPPTFLMGATLPVLTRAWEALSRGAGTSARTAAGTLYAANTLGAVAGVLAASFLMIGTWGETAAVLCAAALNAAAAAGAWTWSGSGGGAVPRKEAFEGRDGPVRGERLVTALFCVSGFCSLGYEVLWSRQLTMILGNSAYAFAMLLSMYLFGMGLGSYAGTRLKGGLGERLEAFGWLEIALGAAALLSLVSYRMIGVGMDSPDYLFSPLTGRWDLLLMFMQAAVMVLPVSLVLGMLFPVAVEACARRRDETGAVVGRLYAFNTLGCIAGSIAVGFYGIRFLGAHRSFLVLAAFNVAAGLAALRTCGPRTFRSPRSMILAAACLLLWPAARDPAMDIVSARLKRAFPAGFRLLFHEESPAATISGIAYRTTDGREQRGLLINGIITAGTGMEGELMSVLPRLFVPAPRSTLVVCFGAGATFRAAALMGGTVDTVDLIAGLKAHMSDFYPDAAGLLAGPERRFIVDDGRNFLLRSTRRYDTIVVDAAPPLYSAGAVNLFSREFMGAARDHLADDGVFAVWLMTQSFEEDYWRIMRGMADSFPHVAVWSYPTLSGMLVFGSARPLSVPHGVLARRIQERVPPELRHGMTEGGLRAGFFIGEEELRAYLSRYPPLTDDHPYTEFPLARFLRNEPLQRYPRFLWKAATRSAF